MRQNAKKQNKSPIYGKLCYNCCAGKVENDDGGRGDGLEARKKAIKSYFLCVAGSLLVAAGVYFFKFPNNFSTGGVSGISVLICGIFNLSSASEISTVINAVLLIIGFIVLGRDCGLKTVIGTAVFSGALMLFEALFPMSGPLTDQPLLELFFAILLPAVGSAILFNNDGSTGGTDIVAMILRKYSGIRNIGAALFVTDCGITLGAFYFGIKTGLFSILGLILKSVVVDSAIENINLCKCFSIITDDPEGIEDFISTQLHRSCTVLEGTGGYSHGRKYLLVSAMKRYQATRLQRFLRQNYPTTFMMITNSSEVIGKGFRGFQ